MLLMIDQSGALEGCGQAALTTVRFYRSSSKLSPI
jgi:hypothetical protein